MLTDKDRSHVLSQIKDLKSYNEKMKEHLSAIQLLMVENNDSRIKEQSVANELTSLTDQIDSITSSISAMERKLT